MVSSFSGSEMPRERDDIAEDVKALEARLVIEQARRAYERRRFRRSWIGSEELFREPAWDILIYLFIESWGGRKIPITEVVQEAYVPKSTALREVHKLCKAGLTALARDPSDGRRQFVELATDTRRRISAYFSAEMA